MNTHSPFDPTSLTRNVPRYTSYPTAPHFSDAVGPEHYARWLSELGGEARLSLYLHIPFCDELCWFCACRTQGSKHYRPVERYLGILEREIEMVARAIGDDRPVSQVHWGGGSPTILQPEDVLRLSRVVADRFPSARGAEFAVEIDPRDITEGRLDALAEAGLTRASVGVQDFAPAVQAAIGRRQGEELTRRVIDGIRSRGVRSVNVDLLYGLPAQTEESVRRTISAVVDIRPDRLALFGYAHVPWMARRQKMIDEAILPGPEARRAQAAAARDLLVQAGYVEIGIDHFALPGDGLARAAAEGRLRRNFQGYTDDAADALVGFGASAIGFLPQGYVQNTTATAQYQAQVEAGVLPVQRGRSLTLDDRARAAAIEQILCRFALDPGPILARFGDFAQPVADVAARVMAEAPDGAVLRRGSGFEIAPAWRDHARLVAAEFDAYLDRSPVRHSIAL